MAAALLSIAALADDMPPALDTGIPAATGERPSISAAQMMAIGDAYLRAGEYLAAFDIFATTLGHTAEADTAAEIRLRMASVMMLRHSPDKALSIVDDIDTDDLPDELLGRIALFRGDIDASAQQSRKAMNDYTESVRRATLAKDYDLMMNALCRMAKLMMHDGNRRNADIIIARIDSIAAAHKIEPTVPMLEVMALRAEADSDYRLALDLHKRINRMADSAATAERMSVMRQSPIFRNISAGRAAVIASDETNLNATQRYTIMLLVTSAAILGVMLILIFRRTRHNRRAFESLAANHELLQTATDRLTTSLSLLQDSSDAQEQLCNSLSSDIIRNNSREVNQRVCRLMYLTENLLAWSLSNDHLAYAKPAEVNVCGVCERVLASLRIEAEARGIVISTVINGDPAVWCDPFHFEVVMRNVLDNAVKYSESDGLLRMAAESDGLQTVIRVSNSGTAMPEMESRNTSRNRCQSPMAGPDGTTGLGIGLAICRRMLAANNGTLTIGTDDSNTQVEIRLPALPADKEHKTTIA